MSGKIAGGRLADGRLATRRGMAVVLLLWPAMADVALANEDSIGRLTHALGDAHSGHWRASVPPPATAPWAGSVTLYNTEPTTAEGTSTDDLSMTLNFEKVNIAASSPSFWTVAGGGTAAYLDRRSGVLEIFGDDGPNTIVVAVTRGGHLAINHGAVRVVGGPATLRNTRTVAINGWGGNDTIVVGEGLTGRNHSTAIDTGAGSDLVVTNAPHSLRMRHLHTDDPTASESELDTFITYDAAQAEVGGNYQGWNHYKGVWDSGSVDIDTLVDVQTDERGAEMPTQAGRVRIVEHAGGMSYVDSMLEPTQAFDLDVHVVRSAVGLHVALVSGRSVDGLVAVVPEPVSSTISYVRLRGVDGDLRD